ncbi:MAG: mechanosensitive ion channel [Flavobacteriaceae bacterium]|nr:mechanosensitive ion channel family protein [Bacteroidia bacterium]MBT8288211.1 mechanosensitive ion channel family protein [Bacteroidia bacterium]NNF75529.1 mechanosensitive ion channel [Flavobacteriaceae bacterium]NNK71992.1 mechanosensitive ion channel [Flavobacteriaceae bacterium]
MNSIKHFIYDYLIQAGMDENWAKNLNMLALLIGFLIVVYILDLIIRKIIRSISHRIAERSKTNFDDILVANKMPRNLAHIIPLLITYEAVPVIFFDFPYFEALAEKGIEVLAIVLTLWIIRSLLQTFRDYFKTLENLKDKPIDSYIQVFMIFAWIFGIAAIVAIITEITFLKFITTMGAASAIIILIFKDTILGFVASIQVSINDMVRIGDWVSFEKYGADGDVTEINLATVKVQNWDKTITTIPTYALISDSFKNWRGMMDSGGRRIKRSLNIKINSVRHLTESDVQRMKQVQLISKYLSSRQALIDEYNLKSGADKTLLINGRNLTNLGVFRKYIQTYVEAHSAINKEMTIMTRQLAPTSTGIPLEIYAFSSDKRWKNYEYIMADIFDHVIASVHEFDLELFEYPNDSNFRKA